MPLNFRLILQGAVGKKWAARFLNKDFTTEAQRSRRKDPGINCTPTDQEAVALPIQTEVLFSVVSVTLRWIFFLLALTRQDFASQPNFTGIPAALSAATTVPKKTRQASTATHS